MENRLYRRYVRKTRHGHKQPFGLLLMERLSESEYRLGYSLCHTSDTFKKKDAFQKALERLTEKPVTVNLASRNSVDGAIAVLPHSFRRTADSFLTFMRGKMRQDIV